MVSIMEQLILSCNSESARQKLMCCRSKFDCQKKLLASLHSTVSLLTQGVQQTMSSNKLKTFLHSIVQSFLIHIFFE